MNYQDFCKATKKNRYFRDYKTEEFLNGIWESSHDLDRQVTLVEGHKFYRAQIGSDGYVSRENEFGELCETDQPAPHKKERMKPISGSATEGRANPKGISYLYLTSDLETAIAEVRPWVGLMVSVSALKIKKDLTLIECADFKEFENNKPPIIKSDHLSKDAKNKLVKWSYIWSSIDKAFSEPINSTDRTAEYVPTQIIAEFFKSKGIDGIAYKSSVSKGVNVVLFDLDMADVLYSFICEVKSVKFKYSGYS